MKSVHSPCLSSERVISVFVQKSPLSISPAEKLNEESGLPVSDHFAAGFESLSATDGVLKGLSVLGDGIHAWAASLCSVLAGGIGFFLGFHGTQFGGGFADFFVHSGIKINPTVGSTITKA